MILKDALYTLEKVRPPETVVNQFLRDLGDGSASAARFLDLHFRKSSDWQIAVERARSRQLKSELFRIIEEQNQKFELHEKQHRSLKKLERGAGCIVTGQQVGLFGGPALTMHKIATTVRLANELEEKTGQELVPLFWIQSEDHDLEEVRKAPLLTRQGELRTLEMPAPAEEWRIPLSHTALPPEADSVTDELLQELEGYGSTGELAQLLSTHYSSGRSYEEAFWGLMDGIWKDTGLLFFSPRQGDAPLFAAPVYEQAFHQWEAMASELQATAEDLKQAGHEVQVHIRDDSPLFFYSPDGPHGARYRLSRSNDAFQLIGEERKVSESELLNSLEQEPARFTSSALLRPIVQDSLLPTVAYIAGHNELRYHAQLNPLYDRFGMERPLVAPRAQFRVHEPRIQELLSELKLRAEEVFEPDQALLNRSQGSTENTFPPPASLSEEAEKVLHELFSSWKASFESLDKNLLKPLEKTENTASSAVSKLLEKYSQALMRRDQVFSQRIARVRSSLKPSGVEQERAVSGIYYLARYGEKWREALLTQALPLEITMKELAL